MLFHSLNSKIADQDLALHELNEAKHSLICSQLYGPLRHRVLIFYRKTWHY